MGTIVKLLIIVSLFPLFVPDVAADSPLQTPTMDISIGVGEFLDFAWSDNDTLRTVTTIGIWQSTRTNRNFTRQIDLIDQPLTYATSNTRQIWGMNSVNGTANLWQLNFNQLEHVATNNVEIDPQIDEFVISEGGQWLAIENNYFVRILNYESMTRQFNFSSEIYIDEMIFGNQQLFYTGYSNGGQIQRFDLASETIEVIISDPDNSYTNLAISQSLELLAFQDHSGAIYIYNLTENQLVKHAVCESYCVYHELIFSADGSTLFAIGKNIDLVVIDVATGTYTQLPIYGIDIAPSPNAQSIAVINMYDQLEIWSLATLNSYVIAEFWQNIVDMAVVSDGELIVLALQDNYHSDSTQNHLVVISTTSGDSYRIDRRGSPINKIALHPNGQILAIAYWDGHLELFDLTTQTSLSGMNIKDFDVSNFLINKLTFSPNGQYLFALSQELNLFRVSEDITDFEHINRFAYQIGDAIFSPDSAYVIYSSNQSIVRFRIDTLTDEQIFPIDSRHSAYVHQPGEPFSLLGSWGLLSTSRDGSVICALTDEPTCWQIDDLTTQIWHISYFVKDFIFFDNHLWLATADYGIITWDLRINIDYTDLPLGHFYTTPDQSTLIILSSGRVTIFQSDN